MVRKDKLDFYPTPKICFDLIQPKLSKYGCTKESKILEPAAGEGSLLYCMQDYGYNNITSFEIDHKRALMSNSIETNFLTREPLPGEYYDFVITNPPFNSAIEFIQHSFNYSDNVIMFLRLAFLESKSRKSFMNSFQPDVYVLSERVSFQQNRKTGTFAMAWFVFNKNNYRNVGRVEVL